MSPNASESLFDALRECGLYTPDQLAALSDVAAAAGADPGALADGLQTRGLLTTYQARKVRLNRIPELLVGPYLLLDKIGEGGMGKVFKAVEFGTGRLIALKVVRSHLMANKVVRGRARREAAAAALLNHPNIVALYDADEVTGRYYMAMEFVDGSDLARLVKEFGPLPYPEACEYVRQAALGLQHAHDQGLIHRDVKPSNLLVSGERAIPGTGGKAEVKILDMGLVRSLADDEADRSELTRDGTVVGTPDYMAPEQAKNSSTVDHRADLYSLGCTLFMLLTGRPPFPDGSPIDKLLRHQLDPPPDVRKVLLGIPGGVAAIVTRLLAKKPEDRFATAGELAAALAPYTTEAPTPADADRTAVPAARRRAAADRSQEVPEGSTALDLGAAGAAPARPAAATARPAGHSPTGMPRGGTPVGIVVRPVGTAGSTGNAPFAPPGAEPLDAEPLDAEPVTAKATAAPPRRPYVPPRPPRPRRKAARPTKLGQNTLIALAALGVAGAVLLGVVLATLIRGGAAKEPPPPPKTEIVPGRAPGKTSSLPRPVGAIASAAVAGDGWRLAGVAADDRGGYGARWTVR